MTREGIAQVSKMTGREELVAAGQIEQEIREATPSRNFDFTDPKSKQAPALQDLLPVLLEHQVLPRIIRREEIGAYVEEGPVLVARSHGSEVGHAEIIVAKDPAKEAKKDQANDDPLYKAYNPLRGGAHVELYQHEINPKASYSLTPGNNLTAVVHEAIRSLSAQQNKNHVTDVPQTVLAEQFRQHGVAGFERLRAEPALALPILRDHGIKTEVIPLDQIPQLTPQNPVLAAISIEGGPPHAVLLTQRNADGTYRAYDPTDGGIRPNVTGAQIGHSPAYRLTLLPTASKKGK